MTPGAIMNRAACLFTFLAVFASVAADWPVNRGNPAQNGVAAESLPDKLAVKWTFKTGGVEGTAAIVGSTVFVGSFDGHVYALDLATGKEKWKAKTGAIKAAVGVHAGRVYVGNDEEYFYCLDANTGAEVWKVRTDAEVTSGPAFTDDSVLFGANDELLRCLSLKDGHEKWQFRIAGGPIQGTPVVYNGKTYAAGCDSTLHVLDLATGNELGSMELGGQVGATSAAADGHLFVGTMTNELMAINLTRLVPSWRFESRKRQPFFASPAVTEKLVVAASRDKRVYALKRKTGDEAWTFLTEGKIDSSPVVAGPRVYVGSFDKNLYVLDLATGKEVQRIALDAAAMASPAVANGCLVIATEKGTVYCLGKE